MADQKISAMPTAATLTGAELVPLVQSGSNVKVTTANLVAQVLNVTPVTVAQGGTGASTLTGYVYGNGTGSFTAATTVPFSGVTGTVPVNQGGTNLTAYTLGDTLYASGTTALSKLAGNVSSTEKFLTQTGTGAVSAAPVWKTLAPSDINTQYGAFHFDKTTTLTQALTINATTANVASTTGFLTSGELIIEGELLSYTGVTATSFTGLTRGVAGSSAHTHANGSNAASAQITVANTAVTLHLNETDLTNGVTLNATTSEISVAIGGVYSITFSLQLFNTSNTQDKVCAWFVVDGTNVVNSASWTAIAAREDENTPAAALATVNLFITLNSLNKVTLKWLSLSGNSAVITQAASTSPSYPLAPALIVTVSQVS